ncbi:MAG: cysteine desulfurase family protein [Chloroflexota bacterium]|nr:cysteine desulfurase family protein [Chloroflexota bacterium]
MSELIYLDHSATTALAPEVLAAMMPYLTEHTGNPSSVHSVGRRARQASADAREQMAGALGCQIEEIVMTSGGTEADNLAIVGVARAAAKGCHIITSAIEHHAVLHASAALTTEGFEVTQLPVDRDGLVSPDDLRAALRDDTVLVTIMLANNEIGTVQPIRELAAIAGERGVTFHTDAVQSVGQLDINVDTLGVDLLSLSAHKFYGPRGVGLLYVRRGVDLAPMILGGGQELDRRSGTENVAGTVGMGLALATAQAEREDRMRTSSALRDHLIEGIEARVGGVIVTGHRSRRLATNASFCFTDIQADVLVISLDLDGVEASAGSACTSGAVEVSHVIAALDLPEEYLAGSLRLTVGAANTPEQMPRAVDIICGHIERMRMLAERSRGKIGAN